MEQAKCFVELNEILKHLDDKYLDKIPVEVRNSISEGKDREYKWTYDESKKLSEQKINRKTIAMLSYLNMEYLLNDEQRELMKEIHYQNDKKINLCKQDNNIAKLDIKNEENITNDVVQAPLPIEAEPPKWYKKISEFFKCILKKRD